LHIEQASRRHQLQDAFLSIDRMGAQGPVQRAERHRDGQRLECLEQCDEVGFGGRAQPQPVQIPRCVHRFEAGGDLTKTEVPAAFHGHHADPLMELRAQEAADAAVDGGPEFGIAGESEPRCRQTGDGQVPGEQLAGQRRGVQRAGPQLCQQTDRAAELAVGVDFDVHLAPGSVRDRGCRLLQAKVQRKVGWRAVSDAPGDLRGVGKTRQERCGEPCRRGEHRPPGHRPLRHAGRPRRPGRWIGRWNVYLDGMHAIGASSQGQHLSHISARNPS